MKEYAVALNSTHTANTGSPVLVSTGLSEFTIPHEGGEHEERLQIRFGIDGESHAVGYERLEQRRASWTGGKNVIVFRICMVAEAVDAKPRAFSEERVIEVSAGAAEDPLSQTRGFRSHWVQEEGRGPLGI